MQESGCVMEQNDDDKPTPVAATPKQAGEARDPWWWVERTVWTERMLTRLTSGEQADRVWFALSLPLSRPSWSRLPAIPCGSLVGLLMAGASNRTIL